MNTTLGEFQLRFLDALFDRGDASALSGLSAQPAFAVYRNTVTSGCIDALEANFQSVVRLVGVDWFRAAAVDYVRSNAPHDGRLLMYGDSFADFIAGYEPAQCLPYLADVARLDRFWIEAHTAADSPTIDSAWLAKLAPESLGSLRLSSHPAARWRWFDELPVYSIWHRNRLAIDAAEEVDWHGEGALLTRPESSVEWQCVTRADIAFLDACAAGKSLADSANSAAMAGADVDIAALLAKLLRAGALIRIETQQKEPRHERSSSHHPKDIPADRCNLRLSGALESARRCAHALGQP